MKWRIVLPIGLVLSLGLGGYPDRGCFAASPLPVTFGSGAVLAGCWSPEELRGRAGENASRKRGPLQRTERAVRPFPGEMRPELSPDLRDSIRSVSPRVGERAVALTIDLCEGLHRVAGYDGDVVDYLRENRVKATFFPTGLWMRSHPERTMQLMADPLFEIGNHSWSHRDFRHLSPEEMEEEILGVQHLYESYREDLGKRAGAREIGPGEMEQIPRAPFLFRFPYGTCTPRALDGVARHGLCAIQWSVVTGDADRRQDAEAIARIVLSQAGPGAIIICHANGRNPATAKALPLFVPRLRSRGFTFVTVSEMLLLGPPVRSRECFETRPGDR